MLRIRVKLLILLSSLAGCSTAVKHCEIPPSILDEVASLKDLKKKNDVPCIQTNSTSELREILSETIDKRLPREQVALEGEILKLLGVIPRNYDYRENIITQYANHLSAFYSPEFKRFVLAKDLGMSKRTILAHELTHALQDQYYDLNRLTAVDVPSDTVLARTAVFEGDANVTMRRFSDEPFCEGNSMSRVLEQLDGFKRRKSDVPLFFDLQMAFPYLVGEQYVCERISASRKSKDGGFNQGIKGIYNNLPHSTGQLLGFDDTKELEMVDCLKRDSYGVAGIASLLAKEVNLTESVPMLRGLVGDKMCLTKLGETAHRLDWRIKIQDLKSRAKLKSMMSNYFSLHIPKLSYSVTEVRDEIQIAVKGE